MTASAPTSPPHGPFASASARGAALAALRRALAAHADAWVAASLQAKGWAALPVAAAEEWASGPLPVARFLAALERGPGRLRARGTFVDGCTVYEAPSLGPADRLLLFGHRAALHARPDRVPAPPAPRGGTCLVLGAGNVTATPVLDVLDQVFVHGRAVVLKPSPLHDALLPVWHRALAPLADAGVLTFAPGDASAGAALARDPRCSAVHLTGSATTWAALRGDALLRGKQLSAEVGCCTPAIVLPGPWSPRALQALAALLGGAVAMNGGATCLAPRVLLTAARWPQRDELLTQLQAVLAAAPPRVPFHPGVRAHWETAAERTAPVALPPLLCADQRGERARAALASEPFAPVLREFALPGDDLAAVADAAAQFVRDHCFGRLSAYVFAPRGVHQDEAAIRDTLIAALPHGTVAVDDWTGLGYGLGTTPWGVPPDSPAACGSGFARDTTGLAVQRTVVRGTLPPPLVPPWSPAHRRGARTLRALTLHTLAPSLPHLLRTALHALRP